MARAISLRIKRLERTLRRGVAVPVPGCLAHESLMRRLAVDRDLFYEFAEIAEGSRSGVDAARVGRLAAALATREARG